MMKKSGKKGVKAGGVRRSDSRKKKAQEVGDGTEDSSAKLINMGEAIGILKTTRPTFYRWLRTGKIKGMKVGRQWRFYREDIEHFLRGEGPRIDLPADIGPLIRTLRRQVLELGGKPPGGGPSKPVLDAVSLMMVLGRLKRASDIHLSPTVGEEGTRSMGLLRYRVDGVLHEAARIDQRLLPAIVEEWKRMAACDIHEKQKSQDGRIRVSLQAMKSSEKAEELDLRVCFLPAVLGESVTVRILDRGAAILTLDRIPYSDRDRRVLARALREPWGTILVAGPTGSGKTTTLYACLNEVKRPEMNVMSVEDPVEYLLPGVTQVPLNHRVGVTFPAALRSILRSAPNVILVGEVRDRETLMIVAQASLTGHLVMTTLHTRDAAGALTRMVDIGCDPFVVADATKLIVSQRLVRCLCRHCNAAYKPTDDQVHEAEELARAGGLDWESLNPRFRKAVGCKKCNRTGYRGRTVIAEMLEVTPEIGRALRNNASIDDLRAIAVGQGMTTMAADGVRRACTGETTLSEIRHLIS